MTDDPSDELDIHDIESFLRHILARVDWRRDLHFQTQNHDRHAGLQRQRVESRLQIGDRSDWHADSRTAHGVAKRSELARRLQECTIGDARRAGD